ncbi:hypothetical protein PG999_010196 [Apiospora kogelbergensis]|uniref:Uncharacterized protein n=1 Tax=Apiospora kogelbergensis TaxID=1337665 RepID=A0AAW0QH58_9PEZI
MHHRRKRRQMSREGRKDHTIPVKRWLRWHDSHKRSSDDDNTPKDIEKGTLSSSQSSRNNSRDEGCTAPLPEKPMPVYNSDTSRNDSSQYGPFPKSMLDV